MHHKSSVTTDSNAPVCQHLVRDQCIVVLPISPNTQCMTVIYMATTPGAANLSSTAPPQVSAGSLIPNSDTVWNAVLTVTLSATRFIEALAAQ